jgi:DNA-binding CsgD family transcriptional regulator
MTTKRERLQRLINAARDGRGPQGDEGLIHAFMTEEAIEVDVRLARLTPRERAVVDLLVAGKSTDMMSAELGLTISTINTYMKRIFAKLEVHSRPELIAYARGE